MFNLTLYEKNGIIESGLVNTKETPHLITSHFYSKYIYR